MHTNTDGGSRSELMLLESQSSLHSALMPEARLAREQQTTKSACEVVMPALCHQRIVWPLDQLLFVDFSLFLASFFH